MADPLDDVLRLVAEGRLTADEAARILDGLDARERPSHASDSSPEAAAVPGRTAGPRFARIQIVKDGRNEVDLRVPLSLGQLAMSSIPGLSSEHVGQIREAINHGLRGPLVDIDDGPNRVRIVIE